MLLQLVQQLDSSGQARKQDLEDFRRLMWASHYIALANKCKAAGLNELAAKQLTAVLRYVGIVPADRSVMRPWPHWVSCSANCQIEATELSVLAATSVTWLCLSAAL